MSALIGEKFTRKDFEMRTGLKGAEATAELRRMIEGGQVQCQLDYNDPAADASRHRVYFAVANTLEMFSHGAQAENAH